MSPERYNGFSWLTLFLVTGASGIVFDLVIWFLDGYHTALLLWIGVAGFVLAGLNILIQFIARSAAEKEDS